MLSKSAAGVALTFLFVIAPLNVLHAQTPTNLCGLTGVSGWPGDGTTQSSKGVPLARAAAVSVSARGQGVGGPSSVTLSNTEQIYFTQPAYQQPPATISVQCVYTVEQVDGIVANLKQEKDALSAQVVGLQQELNDLKSHVAAVRALILAGQPANGQNH